MRPLKVALQPAAPISMWSAAELLAEGCFLHWVGVVKALNMLQ